MLEEEEETICVWARVPPGSPRHSGPPRGDGRARPLWSAATSWEAALPVSESELESVS